MADFTNDPFGVFQRRINATLDTQRASSTRKRHDRGGRTARENLADLVEGAEINEYGQLAVAAQRTRRSLEQLQSDTAGDGVITAIAPVNQAAFKDQDCRTALIVNDYSVLAGTQGFFHHKKIDRLLSLALEQNLPVVMLTEGGGGRPGDTDVLTAMAGLDVPTFHRWAALAGKVPRIAVNHGYCFAGNAALFGCADLRIATTNSWIGMAGPAMIEGGGLGRFAPTEIGPSAIHDTNGVIDLIASDEANAIAMAKYALSFCQGDFSSGEAPSQQALRAALPKNRRMAYDVRAILNTVLDRQSLLELRPKYGRAVITALGRINGRAVAILANDCRHLGGAIDGEAAQKTADFYRLAESWQLPVVSFVDTPGFMVGPDSEATGAPRFMSDMFIAGAALTQPLIAIFLRRGYGLGAMAMTGGSFDIPLYAASWPQGEFGAMGLEGAVHLGFKQELQEAPEGPEREKLFNALLDDMYRRGQATEAASYLEIDAVIDPIETRAVILSALPIRRSSVS